MWPVYSTCLTFFYNVVDVFGLYNQIDLLLGEQRNLGIFFDCKFLGTFLNAAAHDLHNGHAAHAQMVELRLSF